jgi:hypothetical protein
VTAPSIAATSTTFVPYIAGGLTVEENGRLLCRRHNRLAYREWCQLSEEQRQVIIAAQRQLSEQLDAAELSARAAGDGDARADRAPPAA